MFDDHGRPVKQAGPSTPVEVLGLQGVPEAGDQFQVADEAKARHIVEYRQGKLAKRRWRAAAGARITLDQLHEQLKTGEVKELPIVIKADVQGSVEVLSEMLPKLPMIEVKLKIIHASVGAVTETDVLLASASGAIIFAFNVRPDRKASELAQRENVEIRMHSVIYEVSDEIKRAMTGLLEPVFKETHLGRAEVREHVPHQGRRHDRRLLRGGRHHQARRRSARAARRRGGLHRQRSIRCAGSRKMPTRFGPDSSAASASRISTT